MTPVLQERDTARFNQEFTKAKTIEKIEDIIG